MHLHHHNLVAIFTGAVVIDVAFLLMNYHDVVFVSKELTRWYTRLGTAAMAMDILIIGLASSFGIYLTHTLVRKPNLLKTALGVVLVQVVHDLAFALLFSSVPRGIFVMDIFKDYAKEVGFHAVWSDSLMVVGTLFVAEGVVRGSDFQQTIALLVAVYVGLYALYFKAPTT